MEDYQPYGTEWRKEMMKFSKLQLIEMLSDKLQQLKFYNQIQSSPDAKLPDKVFPVEFGGFWELASDYTYQSVSYLNTDNYDNAMEFAHEVAKRYKEYKEKV